MSTLIQHEFLTRHQQKNILKELVQRTKSQVRALDNMNYKRVKKIFMNEGTPGAEDASSFDNDDDASSQVRLCLTISLKYFHLVVFT